MASTSTELGDGCLNKKAVFSLCVLYRFSTLRGICGTEEGLDQVCLVSSSEEGIKHMLRGRVCCSLISLNTLLDFT